MTPAINIGIPSATPFLVLWKWNGRPLDTSGLSPAICGEILRIEELGELSTDRSQVMVYPPAGNEVARVLVSSMGKPDESVLDTLRSRAAEAARTARDRFDGHLALQVPKDLPGYDTVAVASALMEGAVLGSYIFDKYRSKPSEKRLVSVSFLCDAAMAEQVQAGAQRGLLVGTWTNFGKTLSNEPTNHMTPTIFGRRVQEAADGLGLKCTVRDEEWLKANGFGLHLAVGQGSSEPSTLIVLEHYGAEDPDEPAVALVGKGVTFDTGGICIKPGTNMWEMKRDMCGGTTVAAAMLALKALQVKANIVGVIPAAENMPDGKAFRPGDIHRGYNGKTVEIYHTDAEGRLLLGDALAFVQQSFKVRACIDLATLTGGAKFALGSTYVPIFSTHERLTSLLKEVTRETGEPVWELPMPKEYERNVTTHFADLKNSSSKQPSTINGALFLKQFVNDNLPWMHWDIASVIQTNRDSGYNSRGSNGRMTRTLIRMVEELAARPDLLRQH